VKVGRLTLARPENVFVFETPELLAIAGAERVAAYEHAFRANGAGEGARAPINQGVSAPINQGTSASADQERFSLVLAGGNTPRRVYELLASESFRERVAWDRVDIFFGDERCVPPDHPDSNYLMAYQALLSQVPISAEQVRRIRGEAEPDEAARLYEGELRKYFVNAMWPRFALVLLGMGTDGHTASLFPGSAALNEVEKWVAPARASQPPHERVTLTLPVFNQAAHVLFLVSGINKAERLAQVLKGGSRKTEPLPAQLVQPARGSVEWLVDRAAASLL
jgi:6-phosphogluconolactonase